MGKLFTYRKGIYTVPGLGRFDLTKPIDDDKLLKLYLDPQFPWIAPITGKDAIAFLKKQKLSEKQVASLVQRAKTVEEVEVLLELRKTQALKNIAATKIAALQNSNQ